MPPEKAQAAVPGLLGPDRVVLGRGQPRRAQGGFIGKGVVRLIAMELVADASRLQLALERVHRFQLEERILRSPMPHQRHADLAGVHVLQRRASVPDHRRVGFGRLTHGQQRQGAAHAKAGDAHLRCAGLQVLHRAADVLARSVAKIQPGHQVVGLLGLHRCLATVQVGHQGLVAGCGQPVGHAAYLRIQSPPFLDHHDRRRIGLRRRGQIAVHRLPVRALKTHH